MRIKEWNGADPSYIIQVEDNQRFLVAQFFGRDARELAEAFVKHHHKCHCGKLMVSSLWYCLKCGRFK